MSRSIFLFGITFVFAIVRYFEIIPHLCYFHLISRSIIFLATQIVKVLLYI